MLTLNSIFSQSMDELLWEASSNTGRVGREFVSPSFHDKWQITHINVLALSAAPLIQFPKVSGYSLYSSFIDNFILTSVI